MKTITLKIDGMTCQGCVKSVMQILNQVAGVTNVQVDLKNGTATMQWDGTQNDGGASLINAVQDAGFDAIITSFDA